jgi:hypothetical protein
LIGRDTGQSIPMILRWLSGTDCTRPKRLQWIRRWGSEVKRVAAQTLTVRLSCIGGLFFAYVTGCITSGVSFLGFQTARLTSCLASCRSETLFIRIQFLRRISILRTSPFQNSTNFACEVFSEVRCTLTPEKCPPGIWTCLLFTATLTADRRKGKLSRDKDAKPRTSVR